MKTIWTDNIYKPDFPTLNTDISTDILIIGGGVAGLVICKKLTDRGLNCTLVEKREICNCTTCNTTAKITWQHNLIYNKIIEKSSVETARQYYKANKRAFDELCSSASDLKCDFELADNYIYTTNNTSVIKKEAQALKLIGAPYEYTKTIGLPFYVAAAVKTEKQAQFHPLKYLYNISKNLNIYENTFVSKVKNNIAYTNRGNITAKKIIISTHFPFINSHGMFYAKMFQSRSYVLALSGAPKIDGMYLDESKQGFSFRAYNDLLLVGGGNSKTGETKGDIERLKNFAQATFPESEIKYEWAAQDCITIDEMPYIGQYSKNTPNLYVATGFNKWGFTSSMVAAQLFCDWFTNKNKHTCNIFAPSRNFIKKQLFINALSTAKDYLIPSQKRCPHLGCSMKYNKSEHSWDCPCHGTRITEDGTVLDNPANKP